MWHMWFKERAIQKRGEVEQVALGFPYPHVLTESITRTRLDICSVYPTFEIFQGKVL